MTYQHIFNEAVRHYWYTRNCQSAKSTSDRGERSSVTGGKQMDGFVRTISELVIKANNTDITILMETPLPGFFRPTKRWDMAILYDGVLLAAIELKSQVGPSFGNNFNNRAEEAIGLAVDFWTAFREKGFVLESRLVRPWIGYLMLLEDCEAVHKKRTLREPHFKVFPEYRNTTYADRYQYLLQKLVLERHYDATCLMLSSSDKVDGKEIYYEPAPSIGVSQFLTQLTNQIARNTIKLT